MKKNHYWLVILMGIALLAYLSACTKIKDETYSSALMQAMIKGEAKANLDLSNDTNVFGGYELKWEKVPAGTTIYARINSEDLDPTPSFNYDYQDLIYETQVGADGTYEIQVPAGVNYVAVSLMGDDFKYQQKVNDSTYNWKVFTMTNASLSVIKNMVKFQDLTYSTSK